MPIIFNWIHYSKMAANLRTVQKQLLVIYPISISLIATREIALVDTSL